jgi:SnoaL-like domain
LGADFQRERTMRTVFRTLALIAALIPVAVLQHSTFAQLHEEGGNIKDRIAIQEKLLYAYAYAYDSKDCAGWAKLFTTDATLNLGERMKETGRDAIRQACIARQKDVVGNIQTHHYMTNIVFDELTANEAKTRTYVLLTWQKPGDKTPSINAAGIYQDVIVRQSDGKWLFKERGLLMQ